MKVVQLTLEHALALVPVLGARDREEIGIHYADLNAWARSRVELGVAWALVDGEEVIAAGGVITNAGAGVLWLAGREGWARRHIRHALRVFDVIKGFGGYSALRCRCAMENRVACAFAERLGFEKTGTDGGLVTYRMAL